MNNFVNKIVVATLSISFISFTNAQKADTKSKTILESVANNYKSNQNSYFKFAYGTGENGKVSKTQTGTFYTTSSQYKLKLKDVEQIFDGNKVYNISQEDQEITIAKSTGKEMMFSPINYLTSYKKEYNTTYIGKRTISGKNTDLMKLTPVKNNGIKQVYIYVDTPKKEIVKIEQHSSIGEVAIIVVQDYKTNQKLATDFFKFNKNQFKNYIITEL